MKTRALIVGVGSPILGDDGVGIEIARHCKEHFCSNDNINVVEIGTGGLSLLDIVPGYDRVILLDAIISGLPTGTVQVLTEGTLSGAVHLGAGHEADLTTTLALGRKLSSQPLPKPRRTRPSRPTPRRWIWPSWCALRCAPRLVCENRRHNTSFPDGLLPDSLPTREC